MKNIKNNQSGFGSLELILVLIILAMIVGVGWYVYSVNSGNQSTTENNNSTSQTEKSIASDKNSYTFQPENFTLEYPKDWKLIPGEDIDGNAIEGSASIVSPKFKAKDSDGKELTMKVHLTLSYAEMRDNDMLVDYSSLGLDTVSSIDELDISGYRVPLKLVQFNALDSQKKVTHVTLVNDDPDINLDSKGRIKQEFTSLINSKDSIQIAIGFVDEGGHQVTLLTETANNLDEYKTAVEIVKSIHF